MPRLLSLALCLAPAAASFVGTPTIVQSTRRAKDVIMMPASKGPFKLPQKPANFDGAQWAPTEFLPFPINIKPAAAAVKELLAETEALAVTAEKLAVETAAVVEAPAAPPAEAAPADPNKSTYTVTLKTPDGDMAFECPPDMYMLDQTEELDNADDYADLPFACRAGSCSACAAKVVSGTVDSSDCAFLDADQKGKGFILTCTARPTSDCVIETHKEDDLY